MAIASSPSVWRLKWIQDGANHSEQEAAKMAPNVRNYPDVEGGNKRWRVANSPDGKKSKMATARLGRGRRDNASVSQDGARLPSGSAYSRWRLETFGC